jgi:uncharacterized repeat protein (TIGR01451 family)
VVGDTISYTLMVTNTGSETAQDVTVTDDLPDLVTCQSVSGDNAPAGGCADPLIWQIPILVPSDSATLVIAVTINPGAEGQSIINTAGVTATNVIDPVDPPETCPDGSPPDAETGECEITPGPAPGPEPGGVYLPLILRKSS